MILKDYISHVKNHHRPYYISVVGNKSDLDHMREITNEYAKKRLNMRENNIFEVSATSSEHISTIQSIFEEMTSNIAVQKAIRPELIDRSLALEDKNSSEPKKKRTIRRKFRRRTSTLWWTVWCLVAWRILLYANLRKREMYSKILLLGTN